MVLMETDIQNKCTTEYLSNDILNDEFVKVFKPFRIVQKLLGTCRVDVKDKFVTAPSSFQKCYTIICIAIITYSFTGVFKTYSSRFSTELAMNNLWMAALFVILAVYSVSIINSRFFNNEGNVKLYIKMQEIDLLMKLDEQQSVNNNHYKLNRIISLIVVAVFVIIFIVAIGLTYGHYGIMELLGPMWTLLTLTIEVCSCSSNMIFFTIRIRLINSTVANHFKDTICRKETLKKGPKSHETKCESFESKDTDVFLAEIFSGFKSFRDQYSFQIFLSCTESVAWILFTMKYGILILQSREDKYLLALDLLFLGLMALIKTGLLLVLCLLSEIFFREVYKTKKLSIFVLSKYVDGRLRRKAKNMLKLIEDMPPRFSVYGMWRMDARLILHIFHITSTFLVIILQFAFL